MNPFNLVQAMRNPQQFVENALKTNPMLKNNQPLMSAYNAMQNGKPEEAEKIARNVCTQNGTTTDEMISKLKGMMGMQ